MIRLASLLTASILLIPSAVNQADADAVAVERAVQNYVEAFYQVRPELVELSVHPDLVKRGAWRPSDATEYHAFSLMTYEQLHDLASAWNANGRQGEGLTFEIEVKDVMDITASAKLSARWGVDHMQLMKQDGEWKIIHVLWQSHPPKTAVEAGSEK